METIIFPGEAEAFVESLEEFPMEEIGSKSWQLHHERVEKLNQQAVASATCQTDEFVKVQLRISGDTAQSLTCHGNFFFVFFLFSSATRQTVLRYHVTL